MGGATRIYGLDINKDKFEVAKDFGCTECYNPLEGNAKDWLMSKEKWGIDYTYDCTGNVMVMRDALEAAHRGWGESCVIGVAAAGKELATRPFQLITGRCWKGTAFGGWKSRQDVPKLVNKILLGELPIEKFITHNFEGLPKVGELVHALEGGSCLRGILHINEYLKPGGTTVKVVGSNKVFGGHLKTVKHWSECNKCEMTFNIFLPNDSIRGQRMKKAWPVIYFLSGLTCTQDNFAQKSGFAQYAQANGVAIVMPDTSPRGLDFPEVNDNKDWKLGYGAGHYCNATAEPWCKNFNMYTYVTKELPNLVNQFFPVDPNAKSVMGHSMGGNGALVVALRNAKEYKSVSAFSPIASPSTSGFSADALDKYFGGDKEKMKEYGCVDLINQRSEAGMRPKDICPPCLVDTGTSDNFEHFLTSDVLKDAAGKADLDF